MKLIQGHAPLKPFCMHAQALLGGGGGGGLGLLLCCFNRSNNLRNQRHRDNLVVNNFIYIISHSFISQSNYIYIYISIYLPSISNQTAAPGGPLYL